jgi:hypothetical protein
MQEELELEKQMKKDFAPFLERGFSYEYTYEKGGDSSCSYIYRFRKGRDYFDIRELSGGDEINLVVHARGEVSFPSLKYLYKKEFKAFFWKHFLKKSTREERRKFMAELLVKHMEGKTDFFGIPL